MAEPTNEMGDYIEGERRRRGWSQQDMSRETGWHQTKVSKLENGWCRPTLDDLELLADMFGASLPRLVLMRKRCPQRLRRNRQRAA